jgi:hypothetical protein
MRVIAVDDVTASRRALEQEHNTVSAEGTRLEDAIAGTAVETQAVVWSRDFQHVEEAHMAAASASRFRRRGADEACEKVRRGFIATHSQRFTVPSYASTGTGMDAAATPSRSDRRPPAG